MNAAEHTDRWVNLLRSTDTTQQKDALREISACEDVSGCTLECLALIASHHSEVRMLASEALETSIKPAADDIRRLTAQLIGTNDGEVCYWAAILLGRLGPIAGSAVDALEICARDREYLPARERSVWALCHIGTEAESALPTLLEIADDAPARLQRLSLQAIEIVQGRAA